MGILNLENTVILVVDIQEKLLNAVFNKEVLEKKSEIISKAANILELPAIVTEQYPKGLGETISVIKTNLPSNTRYFEKTSFNAFVDEDLVDYLKSLGRKQLIVCGIETHICVHQSVDFLIEHGYDVTLLSDACGSRAEAEYNAALDVMKSNGANVKTTEMVLFELLKGAKHPKFKEIQGLIK